MLPACTSIATNYSTAKPRRHRRQRSAHAHKHTIKQSFHLMLNIGLVESSTIMLLLANAISHYHHCLVSVVQREELPLKASDVRLHVDKFRRWWANDGAGGLTAASGSAVAAAVLLGRSPDGLRCIGDTLTGAVARYTAPSDLIPGAGGLAVSVLAHALGVTVSPFGVLATVEDYLTATAPKQQHPPGPLSRKAACHSNDRRGCVYGDATKKRVAARARV